MPINLFRQLFKKRKKKCSMRTLELFEPEKRTEMKKTLVFLNALVEIHSEEKQIIQSN